jgi:hypothetical protein
MTDGRSRKKKNLKKKKIKIFKNFFFSTNAKVNDNAIMTQVFFVVEHQPLLCSQYPEDGKIVWTDINIEVENKPVPSNFVAKKFNDHCDCTPYVVSNSSVYFTWKP